MERACGAAKGQKPSREGIHPQRECHHKAQKPQTPERARIDVNGVSEEVNARSCSCNSQEEGEEEVLEA